MTPRATIRQADIQRMIRAAKAEGFASPVVDLLPNGGLRLLTKPDAEDQPLDAFEAWERENGLRAG